jgi:hypothetical protein
MKFHSDLKSKVNIETECTFLCFIDLSIIFTNWLIGMGLGVKKTIFGVPGTNQESLGASFTLKRQYNYIYFATFKTVTFGRIHSKLYVHTTIPCITTYLIKYVYKFRNSCFTDCTWGRQQEQGQHVSEH